MTAYLSLKSLPDHLRPYVSYRATCTCHTHDFLRYLSVYLASFFSLPVKRLSGEKLSHEEVVNRLDNDTVAYDVNLGVGDRFSELLRVRIKVDAHQYETAIAWLRDVIYGSEFTKDR